MAVGPARAQDVNGFYVTKDTAEQYDLETVSDLTAVAPELVFGGPPECLDRPLCLGDTSQQLYGLNFKEVKKLDAGGPITNQALDDDTIDVGLLFTGSSVIKPDYVLLKDDKGLQPADNPIALVTKDKAKAEVVSILESVERGARLGRVQRDGAQGLQRQGRPGDRRHRVAGQRRPDLAAAGQVPVASLETSGHQVGPKLAWKSGSSAGVRASPTTNRSWSDQMMAIASPSFAQAIFPGGAPRERRCRRSRSASGNPGTRRRGRARRRSCPSPLRSPRRPRRPTGGARSSRLRTTCGRADPWSRHRRGRAGHTG